jgi:hypothetical protein
MVLGHERSEPRAVIRSARRAFFGAISVEKMEILGLITIIVKVIVNGSAYSIAQ